VLPTSEGHGPVQVHQVITVARHDVWTLRQAAESTRRVISDDAQPSPVAFDLHWFARFEHAVEHSVDVLAQFRRSDGHRKTLGPVLRYQIAYVRSLSSGLLACGTTAVNEVSHASYGDRVSTVSVRDLRNHGGEVIDRVLGGDTVVVTRAGHEVAELRPLKPPALDAATLLARWRNLPKVDPVRFRDDVDSVLDASL
jgi:prevent-host-death family protein